MVDTTNYTGYVEVVELPNLVEMFSYLHGSMPLASESNWKTRQCKRKSTKYRRW